MFSFFKNIFCSKQNNSDQYVCDIDGDAPIEERVHFDKTNGDCPKCKDGTRLFKGPEGGLSINLICRKCQSRWNFTNTGIDYIDARGKASLQSVRRLDTI